MVFMITLASIMQTAHLGWGLVATEVLLIALPTLLFLRLGKVSFKSGLRLKPISPLTGMLCVVLGMSMYLFVVIVEGIMAQLTGMQSVPIQSDLLPKSVAEVALLALAMSVSAPVCEEMMFRGAIQGAYEARKSAGFAITMTALMFAFFHFRVSGLPGLIPVAFVLGYVAWLTRSLYATILVHFGLNGMSSLQSILVFAIGKGIPFLSLWSGLVGLVLAITILLVLKRLYRAQSRNDLFVEAQPAARKSWLASYWPLFVAGALYLVVAGMTVAEYVNPTYRSATSISYGMPSMSSPVETRYEISHRGGQPVGEMTCRLQPAGSDLRLDCTRTIQAYEYRSGNSYYKDGNHTDTISAAWDGQTMTLVDFSFERVGEEGSRLVSTVDEGTLTTTDAFGSDSVTLPKDALIEFEWAWHAALLKADSGRVFSMPFAHLMMWDESKKKSVPTVRPEIMTVGNEETVALAKGDVEARKLTLGNLAAWYAKRDAVAGLPRPAKFDDGALIYTMTR
jgi:membrane protease YdiL (CAAX protease family)